MDKFISPEPLPTPERDRLAKRYEEMGITHSHISWEPGAAALSAEERCAVINNIFDQVEAREANSVPVPVADLCEIYKALALLLHLSKIPYRQWDTMPVVERDLRRKIGDLADMPAISASQRIPRDDLKKVDAEIKAIKEASAIDSDQTATPDA